MKKIIIVLLLSAATITASAQTSKGRYLIGGSMRLRALRHTDDISITPSFGYFFFNNFAAGTALDFTNSKTGTVPRTIDITTLGAGPFVRYYIGNSSFRPFLHGDVNFVQRNEKIGTEAPIRTTGANYFIGPGVAFFLHRHSALEGFAGYEHIANAHRLGDGGFALRIGFRFI